VFGPDIQLKVDVTNGIYKGLDIQGSNIMFLTQSEDPWQGAGMKVIHDPVA
jgi:hypothetical protein